MRSLFLTVAYLLIIALGFQASYVWMLGYVWVDIFTPQLVAYSILPSIPVSMILAVFVLVGLLRLPKDPDVVARSVTVLTVLLGAWMSLTLLWAEVPDAAFAKWNWAIKSVLFSCCVPYFLRSRIHIEAFLWTLVLSGIAHCLPFGAKVLISGGGYGMPLGLVNMNHGYGESSTLAMFAVSLVPICLYLYKWQTLLPHPRLVRLLLVGFIILALLTSIGTYARTGLISIGVLGMLLMLRSRRRLLYLVVAPLMTMLLLSITSESWMDRMSTIGDSSEESAMGRVAVWLWTLKYVITHPWGGSFDVFLINEMTIPLADGSTLTVLSKAFHSIYFEILGETGIPGFALFLAIVLVTRRTFVMLRNERFGPDAEWLSDVGQYLLFTLYVFLAGGAFIGIGFQSYFYYLAALSVALLNIRQKIRRSM